jgi:hypothetical protein
MAITNDGSQKFGITTTQASVQTQTFIVESFTSTRGADRVDLNDGNGEPLGSVTVPSREEVSMTLQVGTNTNTSTFQLSAGVTFSHGGKVIVVTSADLSETQADYRRYNVAGYVAINIT